VIKNNSDLIFCNSLVRYCYYIQDHSQTHLWQEQISAASLIDEGSSFQILCRSSFIGDLQLPDHFWAFVYNSHLFINWLSSHLWWPGQCILCPSCITNLVLEERLVGQDLDWLYSQVEYLPTCSNLCLTLQVLHIDVSSLHELLRIVTWSVQL